MLSHLRWGCFLHPPLCHRLLPEPWGCFGTLLLRDHKSWRRCFFWHRLWLHDARNWRCLFLHRLRLRHLTLLNPWRRISRRKRPGPGFLLHHYLTRRSAVTEELLEHSRDPPTQSVEPAEADAV